MAPGSPFKTAVSPQGSTIISDLASDDAGQVTLVYESIVYPTSQVLAVNGSISNNTGRRLWFSRAPTPVSARCISLLLPVAWL